MGEYKKIDFIKIILTTIAAAGVISIAIAAPNLLGALVKLGFLEHKKYRPKTYINHKLESMVAAGLLQKTSKNGTLVFSLTKKGTHKLEKYRIIDHKKIPRKWDKKWRVLIFDIWEKRRKSRDMLRQEIKNYGFVQLQQSVWIYPYPCAQFIELLKSDLHFGKNVRYMIVEKIDQDQKLKDVFGLN